MNRTLWDFFTSFEGRASRTDYLVRFGVPAALISVAAMTVDIVLAPEGSPFAAVPFGWANVTAQLLLVWPNLALQARRLHDTGRSAARLLVGVGGFACAMVAFALMLLAMTAGGRPELLWALTVLAGVGAVIGGAFSLWTSVITMIFPGAPGENRFGADPLKRVPRTTAAPPVNIAPPPPGASGFGRRVRGAPLAQ